MIVRQLLDAFGIKHYELDQYEADDIIGTISKQASEQKKHTNIITGDKDLLQLADDYTTVSISRKVPLIWKNTHQLQFLRKWVFPEIN